MKFVPLAVCAFLAMAPVAVAPAAHAQLTREAMALRDFGEELDYAATAPDFVGLAVAVVKDGKIALVKTYGVRDAGGTQKVTPDTVFRLASLSKGFAGTLAAIEAKNGKLDLSTKAVSIVPQLKMRTSAATEAITLEDVLSHRSGLPPYAYDNLLEAGTAPLDILSKYNTVKLTCAPGECFTYQNTMFNIIAPAIEKASGNSYAEELRRYIIDPLGLTTTTVGKAGLTSTGNWARPHRRKGDIWYAVPVTDPYYKVPAAGGVNSSINDLAKWMIAQMGERPDVLADDVLDNAHRKRISTPSESARTRSLKLPVKSTAYGLGWRTYDYAGHKLINHSGSVEGYFAQIAWLPESRNGIVVLSNTRGSRATKIVPAWLDYELKLPKNDWFRMEDLIIAASPNPATVSGE
ncbi:MAG: serine hydrolase domain-containing protein [Hyphomonadaceae bacterium]|nr:serine hydrolase domain-containing protein [Hyphomonadaceae bacterium]